MTTSINSVQMPLQFSYEMPSMPLRQSVHQTLGGNVWVYSDTRFYMDAVISWTCNNCTISEMQALRAALDVWGSTFSFEGHWGESMTVSTFAFDSVEPKPGRLFDLSGSLLVTSATTFTSNVSCYYY